MSTPAIELARWATALKPNSDDLALAQRALTDTVAVTLAACDHPLRELTGSLPRVGRWAALAHVLDFDDLHLESTTHISAVCVPVAVATGGGARAYLAGAGVMARLGSALGWRHYSAGWHATCTAGAPGAAVAAAVAMGLGADEVAAAIALALPGAGGVQRAFGTSGKALQVAHAAETGLRAAELAHAGARAEGAALEDWMRLVGGDPAALALDGPAVPGGLAIKLFPCCYALQRPISAVAGLGRLPAEQVSAIRVRTPDSGLVPLIHPRPSTGLEGKFSLEYGIAATILDGWPGLVSFTDQAVARPEARRLIELVEVEALANGEGILAGELEVEVELEDGQVRRAQLTIPPGAPGRPPSDVELEAKVRTCAPNELRALSWESATASLDELIEAR